jgi:hypothetical protein
MCSGIPPGLQDEMDGFFQVLAGLVHRGALRMRAGDFLGPFDDPRAILLSVLID